MLRRYRPLVAEHLMWVTDPGDDRSGTDPRTEADPWTVAVDHYRDADPVAPNPGTDPHLESIKYTGYGLVLRAGVDTPEETSVHLMQLDEGPNYRWGIAGQGGCGVLYYAAAGDVYSHNGKEDVGDRRHHDTDFCTNFGVWKDGAFRSIGRNTLEEPMYDLGTVTYGKLTAKDGENAYARPEYRSRSVLLADTDYILTYDAVFSEGTEHRLSWFTHVDDELPAIHLVEGGGRRTTVATNEVHGVWHDGSGDCMAVVSRRDDLAVTNTEAGCRVERPGGVDRAFRDQDRIEHDGDEYAFTGRAGLVREHDAGGTDLTLLDGTRLATGDLALSTPDGASVAVEARVHDGADVDRVDGRIVNRDDAPVPVTVDVGDGTLRGSVDAYLDGDRAPIDRGRAVFEVPPGDHRWEITGSEPTPPRSTIERTETGATEAVVHFTEAPAATGYRVELSHDAGESWDPVSRAD
ncbi:MAG: hypothetical protein BRD40_01580, partial [Bacteroidetes bacterium QS_1_65_9]